MTSPKRLAIALAIVVVAVLLIWSRPGSQPGTAKNSDSPKSPHHSNQSSPAQVASLDSPPGTAPGIDPTNTDSRFTRFTDDTVHLNSSITASLQLNQGPAPRNDLSVIEQLIADYRLIYQENPVGTENAEIISQLLGKNPKKVVFIAPNLPALNDRGELLDRWGSPYIFHPLKADLMDVRSLGPDRQPWTDDDLTLDLEDIEAELQLNR